MGLSVYYSMKVKTDAEGARRLVGQMRAFAKTLPYDVVTGVEEYDPPDGRYHFERGERESPWKPGDRYLTRKRADGLTESVLVPAIHVMGFMGAVAGSEPAQFGLATHPPVVLHREDVITQHENGEDRHVGAGDPIEFPTRLRGWYSFSAACKTQYASNPAHGGPDNFLRAHTLFFRMMDECKRLGMTTYIRDDAQYWRHRDEKKLLAELKKWDELIAGFAGRLSDALGNQPGALVAPIKDRPDFEHLEAKGARRLEDVGRGKKRRKRSDGGPNTPGGSVG